MKVSCATNFRRRSNACGVLNTEGKLATGSADPAANETLLDCGRARRHRGRSSLGARKPEYKLDPGLLEHPRLSPKGRRDPGARFVEYLLWEPHADGASGGPDASLIPTLLRSRRA